MLRFTAIVRLGIALLLIAAAALKLYGLGISAMPSVGWFAQPWVQLAAAEWELVLGLWLLSGSFPKASWFAAVGTFLAFAGVSGYLGINGVASCGCLGAVQASPWWAFGIDAAALAMLGVAYPRGERISSGSNAFAVKWIGGVVVLLVGATIAASAMYGSPEAALARLRGKSLITDDVDLGTGKTGEILEGAAIIRNVTYHPIRLVGGSANCGCTVLSDLPVTVKPGGSASVRVILTIPATSQERMNRGVMLRTDDVRHPTMSFQIHYRVD